MKAASQIKSGSNTAASASQPAAGVRPHSAKTWEHRYERRKVRAQLRRPDAASTLGDAAFA
jgi:hypothetical protein